MIEYACLSCGGAMSSPDSLSGRSDSCPSCGKAQRVPHKAPPPGPWTRWKQHRAARKQRRQVAELEGVEQLETYRGLRLVMFIFEVYGGLIGIAAMVVLFLHPLAGGVMLIVCILSFGMASALGCLRDMAANSSRSVYRLRRIEQAISSNTKDADYEKQSSGGRP